MREPTFEKNDIIKKANEIVAKKAKEYNEHKPAGKIEKGTLAKVLKETYKKEEPNEPTGQYFDRSV